MTMKTMLLGAAAGLTTIGAAQAADLPMLKAEPVEYVKVCSEFGAGFFYIPGTDTCLKISGELRADYTFAQPQNTDNTVARENDLETFQGRARVQFDARTATDYGTLRSFISVDFLTPDAVRGANGVSTNRGDIDKAFIQFGGFTAGFAESFFAFYDNLYGDTLFASYFGQQGTKQLFAYTATFGGGFAATLSVEDASEHRSAIDSPIAGVDYGGRQMPDFVGSLFYDAGPNGFGKAQVMAAVHQVRNNFEPYDTDYGFAVGAGASVNLPFLAGAYAAIEGEYAQGAMEYIGAGSLKNGIAFDEIGGPVDINDNADTDLGSGFSVEGEVGFNITPALTAIVFGSYINYDAPGVNGFDVGGVDDFDAFIVGGNLTYTVAKGLTVGAEVSYQNEDVDNGNDYGATDFDRFQGGVRIKRTF